MHGEKRKNCNKAFLQQPMICLNKLQETKRDRGGKTKANLSQDVQNKNGTIIENSLDLDRCKSDSICDSDNSNIYDKNGNITTKKKKSPTDVSFETSSSNTESKNSQSFVRCKTKKGKAALLFKQLSSFSSAWIIIIQHILTINKKTTYVEPLPMKLRALPQSFWQQPNNTPCQSPGTVCPDLPLPCKEEEEISSTTSNRVIFDSEDAQSEINQKEKISDANTDLLFSLFRVVEEEQRRNQGLSKYSVIRRGRPKKSTNLSSRVALKDDDPCLISTVTESLLPLLPERPSKDNLQTRITQEQQALVLVSLSGDSSLLNTNINSTIINDQNYSHLLSEVVIRL